MASPDDGAADALSSAAGTALDTLVETTLHDARIAVLAPSRMVVVGDGLRLRIDRRGVRRQPLSELRLTIPVPGEAVTDRELQQILAGWAGAGILLHAHELVHAGDRFARTLHLTNSVGTQVTLGNGGCRARR